MKGADNVDIGCGDAFGGGDDAVDDTVEKVGGARQPRQTIRRVHFCRKEVVRTVVELSFYRRQRKHVA